MVFNSGMKYRIEIKFKDGIKDIQSEAILKTANANTDLGNNSLINLHMYKGFIIECKPDFDIDNLCDKLLANNVIEQYTIEPHDVEVYKT